MFYIKTSWRGNRFGIIRNNLSRFSSMKNYGADLFNNDYLCSL